MPSTFTVQDDNAVSTHSKAYDSYPGAIRNGRYKILVNGNSVSTCSNLQPALIGSDIRVGSIGCNHNLVIPSGQATITPTITVVADTGSYYAASSGQTSVGVAINLPTQTIRLPAADR